MSLANCGLKFFIYFLIIIELNRVQSDGNILGFVKDITNGLVNDVASVLQDPMCQMKTVRSLIRKLISKSKCNN